MVMGKITGVHGLDGKLKVWSFARSVDTYAPGNQLYLRTENTDDARAYVIADNRLAEESEWDFTLLADLIVELDTGEMDLTDMGFSESELEQLMTWTPAGDKSGPSAGPVQLGDMAPLGLPQRCPKCGYEWR